MYWTGRPLDSEIRLLMGIRGITPLLALIFLSEVGDITRFSSARKMYAYLGWCPGCAPAAARHAAAPSIAPAATWRVVSSLR